MMRRAGHDGIAGAAPVAAVASEHAVRLVGTGDEVTFGRDPAAGVRIGAAPVRDPGVPRCAGRIVVEGEGVVVENLATDRCLRVVPDGGQAEALPPAGRTRPRTRSFAVLVDGDLATHELLVSAADGGGLHLREAQRRLLDAYAEPVEHGDLVPTHEEVAAALGLPTAAVRARCHELRGELRLAGVEVRALGDVREEVVDAWTRLPH